MSSTTHTQALYQHIYRTTRHTEHYFHYPYFNATRHQISTDNNLLWNIFSGSHCSTDMFRSSKFKLFQKSSWALAVLHCLQTLAALQRLEWSKKEKTYITRRTGKDRIPIFKPLATNSKYHVQQIIRKIHLGY